MAARFPDVDGDAALENLTSRGAVTQTTEKKPPRGPPKPLPLPTRGLVPINFEPWWVLQGDHKILRPNGNCH